MKRLFIDTNIFIYAQGLEHKYKQPCQIVMRLVAADEIYGVTNTEVLQEIMYRYDAIGKREIGLQMVDNVLAIIHEVLAVEKADVLLAAGLLRKHQQLNIRDAFHAATAVRNNLKYILSVDKHFDLLSILQRVDPFDI
ncbi:type II toxin-antitoxin system VapC family toxin [Candidatus Saganbacteria bacterium]|nr:type II toxin-antitoxin system VapC family toxin [Candidatus Saganbacteria bacterium]